MPPTTDRAVRWKTAGEAPLGWRCWKGDYVVFSPLSGHTHVLDVVAGEVLKAIMASPSPESELCARIAGFLDVDNDGKVTELVKDILAKLDELALVEATQKW